MDTELEARFDRIEQGQIKLEHMLSTATSAHTSALLSLSTQVGLQNGRIGKLEDWQEERRLARSYEEGVKAGKSALRASDYVKLGALMSAGISAVGVLLKLLGDA